MNLAQRIASDRQIAARVVYVEGPSDVEALFALLGAASSPTGMLDGVLITAAGGVRQVEALVGMGVPGVRGIIDGDGRPLADNVKRWDPPPVGAPFVWPAYDIESLMAQLAWPDGDPPAIELFGPYAARNAVVGPHRAALHGLERYEWPRSHTAILDGAAMREHLLADRHAVCVAEFGELYDRALAEYVAAPAIERHARFSGKAMGHLGGVSLNAWCAAVRGAGGHPDVRRLWPLLTA